MSEEKVYTSMYSRNAELYHHGVKGQKWGVENGPPYPLSDEISTGRRLKKIEKLQEKSEKNRGYMKKHEDYYDNKTKKEVGMKKNDRDKTVEKANKKFEKQKSQIEKHNAKELKNDKGHKKAKEDALKAEIKMKKLLAKENGGKYKYKDMTDEEKKYYKTNATKKILTAVVLTTSIADAASAGAKVIKDNKQQENKDNGLAKAMRGKNRNDIDLDNGWKMVEKYRG